MRIGIIGGAFDPITTGHLRLGISLTETKLLDELWYLPCYISYYDKKMAPASDRLRMCQLAVESINNPKIKVCDFEIRHQSTGCSEEIWDQMMNEFDQDHQYYFIIGMDNANKIRTWGNTDVLIKKINFLIVPRVSYEPIQDEWYQSPPHIIMDNYKPDEISSTQTRKELKSYRYSEYVTENVLTYILERELYK